MNASLSGLILTREGLTRIHTETGFWTAARNKTSIMSSNFKDPLCSRMHIRESVWNVFFVFLYFSIFVCTLYVLYSAALVSNK